MKLVQKIGQTTTYAPYPMDGTDTVD
jgi:hypothetical protein